MRRKYLNIVFAMANEIPPEETRQKKNFTFRLNEDFVARFDEAARADHRNRTNALEAAMHAYIKDILGDSQSR
jgi:hypothetical protein